MEAPVKDEYHIHIFKRNNETTEQFEFRRHLYNKILNDIKDEEKALIYSNIWVNIITLGCTYPNEVMKLLEKYKPVIEEGTDELNYNSIKDFF